tara:strand:+ start:2222 stop:3307 length:1086 start_codon:yes stop_codon:yes gene_type:complete
MSEIKVNSIKGVGASAAAITVNNSDGTCTVNNTQRQGKNLVINGDMRIAQRSQSSTSSGYQTVDRFKAEGSNTGQTATQSQQDLSSSDTPYTLGFRKYMRIALASGGTANANASVEIQQRIEAQDVANSGWNVTSSSSNITLSFWFRPSTNQTFYGYLYSFDGTAQVYTFSFTASGNNTWTKITKTIPGNSNLTIDNNNGPGLQLKFIAFYGTDYSNNKTLDQWAAYDGANQLPDMASTWLTTGTPTFDVTGVQLEVGSFSSDFQFKSLAEELALCQRYYHELDATNWFNLIEKGSTYRRLRYEFPVTMRATPTVTNATGTNNGSSGSPSGTQHGSTKKITFHWDSPGLVYLNTAEFSAEL